MIAISVGISTVRRRAVCSFEGVIVRTDNGFQVFVHYVELNKGQDFELLGLAKVDRGDSTILTGKL